MNNFVKASDYCKSVFDGTHDTPKPTKEGHPLVTSKHIGNGTLNISDTYNISEEDYISINLRSKVSKWDILFSMIGSIGNLYMEKNDNIEYAIKNLGVFSCQDEYKAKWLYYYLQSPYAHSYIDNYLAGAVQKFLPLGTLRDFPVIEYDESKKGLIKLLSTIDDKISLNNRINSELQLLIKELYEYRFIQFDFPDKNKKTYKSSGGKMVYNDELKREIPEGWEVKKIKNVIQHINSGLNPRQNFKLNDGGNIKYITVKNLTTDGSLNFEGCDLITQKSKDMINKRSQIREGDILFASIAPLGRCYLMYETPTEWEINESVFSIRSNDLISPEYLYMYFMSEEFVKMAEHSSTGSIFSGIRIGTLENIEILVPNKKIIEKFSERIHSLYSMGKNIDKQNQKLSELRDSLLPMLMNGQVTVKYNNI